MSKFKKLINDERPVLVDFYADWCGPCQTMTPVLQRLTKDIGHQVKVVKVNIDKNAGAAMQYNVRSIPTLLLFKKGNVVWRHTGILTGRQIKESIHQFI